MQRTRGLYKVRKLQGTFLKVMCQQFHGTGSLERNFPGQIWKMSMKRKMCVSGNFGSVGLDGSLVGDSFAGWLLKPSVSVLATLSSFHLSFFTPLKETGQAPLIFSQNWIPFGIHSFLSEIMSEIFNIFHLLFLLKTVFQRAVTPHLPSLSLFTLFTVVKTFFPNS